MQIKFSNGSVYRILNKDLGPNAYKRPKCQILNARLKNTLLTRVKTLKGFGRGGFKKILFSDEKIFTVEEHINKQNTFYYAKNYREVCEKAPGVERAHHPEHIMVWWGVSFVVVTPIHFCYPGIKTDEPVLLSTKRCWTGWLNIWVILRFLESHVSSKKTARRATEPKIPRNGSKRIWQVSYVMTCSRRHPNLLILNNFLKFCKSFLFWDNIIKTRPKLGLQFFASQKPLILATLIMTVVRRKKTFFSRPRFLENLPLPRKRSFWKWGRIFLQEWKGKGGSGFLSFYGLVFPIFLGVFSRYLYFLSSWAVFGFPLFSIFKLPPLFSLRSHSFLH